MENQEIENVEKKNLLCSTVLEELTDLPQKQQDWRPHQGVSTNARYLAQSSFSHSLANTPLSKVRVKGKEFPKFPAASV